MAQNRRTLYNPFLGVEYLDRGGYAHIFRLPSTEIVLKLSHRIVNGTAAEDKRAAESLEILRSERSVYDALKAYPTHPNIVQCFLSTDIAIFLKFEPDTLWKRLDRRADDPISDEQQFRWIREIASAATWLESLDYFHGDLRPENILLDATEHVKLCDFGRTSKRGTKIEVATYPFYRPDDKAVAGATHEQFAMGSCAFNIRTGEMPYGEWSTPAEFRAICDALRRGEYPPTHDDAVLGDVISSCWHARYKSIKDVEDAIEQAVGTLPPRAEVSLASSMTTEEFGVYVQQCQAFLDSQDL